MALLCVPRFDQVRVGKRVVDEVVWWSDAVVDEVVGKPFRPSIRAVGQLGRSILPAVADTTRTYAPVDNQERRVDEIADDECPLYLVPGRIDRFMDIDSNWIGAG